MLVPARACLSYRWGSRRHDSCETVVYGMAQDDSNELADMKFLTVAEVAAVMRVSKMTVYRLVHGGELAAVRVGRSFRVPERAVHAYLRGAYTEAG